MLQNLGRPLSEKAAAFISLVIVLCGSLFVSHAERSYNQVVDEAFHVAAGMEWLAHGTYYLEALHPPLARAATAIFPFIQGERGLSYTEMEKVRPEELTGDLGWYEGNQLLNWHGTYYHNLLLARLGVLPFFWLAAFLTYRFMREFFTLEHAVAAVFLLCFCPVVLAHASLATTDLPSAAMYLWAIVSIIRCFKRPAPLSFVIAALSFGCACLTKFTLIPFLGIAIFVLTISFAVTMKTILPYARILVIVCFMALPVIWAGYRFSYGPILPAVYLVHHPKFERQLQTLSPGKQHFLTAVNIPAHELIIGLGQAISSGAGLGGERKSYLLGDVYTRGKLDFFPVAILAKTSIPMLLLCAAGLFSWRTSSQRFGPNQMMVLLAGILGPIIIAVPSAMNIGLRHILPIYPFVAMLGAVGVMYLFQLRLKYQYAAPVFAGILLIWTAETCYAASPQFLPYFNELASRDPSHILVDSDLDWGQDFYRLEDHLKDVPVDSVYYSYFGDPDIFKHESAKWNTMTPDLRPKGWVAISETYLRKEPYGWIMKYPYVEIGKSIRLYHFDTPPN